MQKLLLLLLSILFSFPAISQDWQWVRGVGGPNFSESKRISTDAEGNSYVLGNFAQNIRFGTTELQGSVDGEVFLIKYDNEGNLKWAKNIGGSSVVEGTDLFADANGNTFITGNFKGTATLGAYTLTSPDDRGLFVVKLDTNGNVLWAKQGTSSEGNVKGHNITVDQSGNTYVTGNFFKSATFGSTSINATKDEQVFIARYNSNGDIAWVKMAGGLGSCFTHGITTDNSGNLYLAGQFWQTAVFGATTLYKNDPVNSPGEIFLAKYDASGNALWAKQAGGAANDAASSITVDENGNSYLTGFFEGTAIFGTTTVSGRAGKNVFIAKYNTSGGLVWVKKYQGTGDAAGIGIDLDSGGNLYTTGYFEGSLTLGNAILISKGSFDMFFAKYDISGNVTGATQAGGAGMDFPKGLDVDTNSKIYFTGEFDGSATFGPLALSGNIVTGKLNGISYNQEPAPTIATLPLNSSILCVGIPTEVSFATTGRFDADNSFEVQLSNASGSFTFPQNIGNGTISPILVTVPSYATLGSGYRVRVVARSPNVIGIDNGTNLAISKPPTVIASVAARTITEGSITNLYASGADTYDWSPAIGLNNANIANPVAKPLATTTYTVIGTKNGCSSTASVTIKVEPVPPVGSAFAWASVKYDGNVGRASAIGTGTDASGNVYVAGTFSNAITFGSTTLTVPGFAGSEEIFVVKYNSSGQVQWAKRIGGIENDYVRDFVVDANGNSYITGLFSSQITLGAQTFVGGSNLSFFVAKLNSAGEVVWANQIGGPNNSISAIATAPGGEVYLSGTFRTSATFNGISLTNDGTNLDYFLVKYSADGSVAWGKSITGSSVKGYRETDIAVDSEGNIYTTGSFNKGTLIFGAITLTNSIEYTNSFLAKYKANGQLEWAKFIGQNSNSNFHTTSRRVTVDKNNKVFISGEFNQYSKFEDISLPTIAGSNNFLAKYDEIGALLWVTEAGGQTTGLTTDNQGFVYATGTFTNSAIFGTKRLTIKDEEYAVFVVKYNTNGHLVWAEQATASSFWGISSSGIAVDENQNIYLAGEVDRMGNYTPITFGCQTITLTRPQTGSYYLAKLTSVNRVAPTVTTGSISSGSVCAGSALSIPFSVSNKSSTCHSFAVLLSDAQGSFEFAKIIGEGATTPISVTIPANTVSGSGYRIKVISTTPAITGTDNGTNISVMALPVIFINASKTNPCPGTTGIVYTASVSAEIASYTWTVPEGWMITGGQGTNKLTVTAGTASGEVSVIMNSKECAIPVSKSLSVAPANISAPTVWRRDYSICGTTNVVLVATGAPYMATYQWYSSSTGNNPIWTSSSTDSESRFYTPVISATTTFYVSILFASGCESERIPIIVTVKSVPETPGAITASAIRSCTGSEVTYEVPAGENEVGYEWKVPSDWLLLSGQGTSKIKVKVGTGTGNITVAASNQCGYSTSRSLSVEAGTPVSPTTVSGPRCGAGNVSFSAFNAPAGGSYRWYKTATDPNPIAGETGSTFLTPYLTTTTTYYVAIVTAEGCESRRVAVTAVINPEPTINVNAGPDETICEGALGFMLTGASPAGGQWTGKGIETTNGYFSPASAGAGTHELTYSITQNGCTVTDTKIIIINKAPAVTLGTFSDLCNTVRDYVLTGGQPAGGVYSGIGVKNGLFTPVDSVKDYTIAYTYTDNNGCAATSWQPLLVKTCTGIAESKDAVNLIVYPNPTKSDIHIQLPLPSATPITLLLFDVRGQKLLEKNFVKAQGEFKQEISLKDKPRGIYLLKLILKDGVITKRIVVE